MYKNKYEQEKKKYKPKKYRINKRLIHTKLNTQKRKASSEYRSETTKTIRVKKMQKPFKKQSQFGKKKPNKRGNQRRKKRGTKTQCI